nr:MAG TPA: hypothetical protein [Caudoviricetes sp.]
MKHTNPKKRYNNEDKVLEHIIDGQRLREIIIKAKVLDRTV